MTLQELKKITDIPECGEKAPTAKQLRESGCIAAQKKFGRDLELLAYENGYVLYRAGRHVTVFPISLCGDYSYLSGKHAVHLPEQFFAHEKWYLRLVLEGEDRLNRNQDEKERNWNVSYSAISEEWAVMEDHTESVVEDLVKQKTVKEVLWNLPERQKCIIEKYYLQEKTQEQISKELNVSQQAVSEALIQAVHSIQNTYPDLFSLSGHRTGCAERRA